jgi:hypothetical protein
MPIFFAAPIEQYPNYSKVTTVPTATNADASFPAANLLTMDPTQPFKSTTTSSVLTWDLGSVKTFDVISLLYTNLPYEATVDIATGTDGVTYGTTVYSGPALANKPTSGPVLLTVQKGMLLRNATLYNSPTTISTRYLRITVNSNLAGSFPSIGRLFIGTKYVPSTGWQYGSSYEFTDNSKRERTDRGALIVDAYDPIRVANVKMDFLNKTEMNEFIQDFSYWRGSSREILACLDTLDVANMQRNLFYANITEGRRVSFDSYNTHSATWTLESIGAG